MRNHKRVKNSLKSVIYMLLALCFAATAFSGCKTRGNNESGSDVQTDTNLAFSGETVTILSQTYLDPREDDEAKSQTTYQKQVEYIKKIENDLNCKIKVIVQSDYGKLNETFVNAVASGIKAADILSVSGNLIYPAYPVNEWVVPLNRSVGINYSVFDKDYTQATAINGDVYAVTPLRSRMPQNVVFVNKTLFETFGLSNKYNLTSLVADKHWNWEKLKEIAAEAKADSPQIYDGNTPGQVLINSILVSNGCFYVNKSPVTNEVTLDIQNDTAVDALNFASSMLKSGLVGKSDLNWDTGKTAFADGKTLFYIGSLSSAGVFKQGIIKENFTVLPIPIGQASADYINDISDCVVFSVPSWVEKTKHAALFSVVEAMCKEQGYEGVAHQAITMLSDQQSLNNIMMMAEKTVYTTYKSYDLLVAKFVWSDFSMISGGSFNNYINQHASAVQEYINKLWTVIPKGEEISAATENSSSG